MRDPKMNLLNDLRPPGVPIEEFVAIIAQRFSSSVHDAETNFVLYPREAPHELRVEYTHKGDVSGVFALPGLAESKLESIREAIRQEFVDTSGLGTNRDVFFSLYPVRGWWRYRNRFQIVPLPPHAPRVPFLYGEHPFLIEYVYPKADSGSISASRRVREAAKLRLLLNAILIPWIRWIDPRSVGTLSHHWVLTSDKLGKPTVEYLQEFYHYEDSSPADSFSAVDNLSKVVEVSPESYYGDHRLSTGDEFDVPLDLAFTLDQFFGLNETMQDHFLHACYWLSQANQTPSFSLMLLSAVQAIEALTPMPKGGKRCPACGLIAGPGPTKFFNTFLEVFLPESMKAKKGLNAIYKTRSALTHGSSPLLTDINALHWALNPKEFDERETVADALRVARLCLRNWLNCEPFVHEHVEKAAYFLWQKNYNQIGHDREHWFQAITDLKNLTFLG